VVKRRGDDNMINRTCNEEVFSDHVTGEFDISFQEKIATRVTLNTKTHQFNKNPIELVDVALMFLTNSGGICSNLGRTPMHLNSRFQSFSSVPPSKFRDSTPNRPGLLPYK
jgi:hypothetical protein